MIMRLFFHLITGINKRFKNIIIGIMYVYYTSTKSCSYIFMAACLCVSVCLCVCVNVCMCVWMLLNKVVYKCIIYLFGSETYRLSQLLWLLQLKTLKIFQILTIFGGHLEFTGKRQTCLNIFKNKKHSENADTSTSVTFDLELWPWP